MDRSEVYQLLVEALVELFELDKNSISMDSNFYDDLDIDSIDAVDLMVHLRDVSGQRVDPEVFKEIRTVSECVDALETLMQDSG